MNTKMEQTPKFEMTRADLEQLGRGQYAYVRPLDAEQAKSLIGGAMNIPGDGEFYCLYMADGTPVSISDTREAAIANAMANDLTTVHLN